MDQLYAIPPAVWTPADLANAVLLDLGAVAVLPGAQGLVERLVPMVEATDAAKRRASDRLGLERAVGAVVGGVLRSWRKGEAVFRSRKRFTGEPVGYRPFIAAVDGLAKLGLLSAKEGIRYEVDWGGWKSSMGKAARWRPTARLVQLAAEHGVTPENVRAQFGVEFSDKPPKLPAELVERRPLKASYGDTGQGPVLPPIPDDGTAQQLAQEVAEADEFAEGFEVKGCLPPRWRRTFGPSWLLGGRWIALGGSGVYQRLPKVTRADITIDGQPTAEVDVSAAHLSIMHGLLGLQLPEGDPYAIPGLPRSVVKKWVTATLGKGSAVGKRWPQGAVEDQPELAGFSVVEVGAAIIARYPFLAAPAEAVAGPARLCELEHIAPLKRLLTHRLMAIEADALTGAMVFLRSRGILALPVHDSLILPANKIGSAKHALGMSFRYRPKPGVEVRTKVETVVWAVSQPTAECALSRPS